MYSIDSRTIKKNDIFIPIKGFKFDGHKFIPEVLNKGCKKIIDANLGQTAKRYRQQKLSNVIIIGITGSAGKTTVKDNLAAVLSSKFTVQKSHANHNNEIGVPLTILNCSSNTDFLIVEMAMRHRGDIEYLTDIVRPEYAIITNIGSAHLEILKNQRNIAWAKAEIFKFPKQSNHKYTAFLNKQSKYYDLLKQSAKKNGFNIKNLTKNKIGDSNIELVSKIAKNFGITRSKTTEILSSLKLDSPHRQNKINWNKSIIIDDSYNANPESMDFAIDKLINEYPNHNKMVILGEMKELGKKSAIFHNNLFKKINSNPTIKRALFYGDSFKKIVKNNHRCYHLKYKLDALEHLNQVANQQYAILIKGSRSLKLEEIISEIQLKND